ncbi:MAG: glycosyltransferase [Candidatus Micrarchaeaceae archaeon]
MAKIAFVSDVVYPWVKGGVESLEYTEMQYLSKRHNIYCFTLQYEGMKKDFVINHIHYIGVAKASLNELYEKKGVRSIKLALRFARHLPNAIHNFKFDAIYANAFPYLHLNFLKSYAKNTHTRLVIDVAEVWSRERWISYLGKFKGSMAYIYAKHALFGADSYIVNSSSTKKALLKLFPKAKVEICQPILPDKMQPLQVAKHLDNQINQIIYAGRLIKQKRVLEWIDIVKKAHMLNSTIQGLIIGSGPEEAAIRKKAQQLGFIKVLKPFNNKISMYKKLAMSSAFLLMSEREGLSIIILESLALGTPVVLPSYSPVPQEVKQMCIVASKREIPGILAKISVSNKRIFIKNKQQLSSFFIQKAMEKFENILLHK